ncbi:hypothetical protein Pmani_027919 [Petrolisthes manimaculis]|uniref:Fibronectin type-III domain-containing protein n=1 Tax=Petrolisthes manimaculis TaxID=1843537 RepID=A0AAE1P2S6_9EUCA|nr:hypothetical protein Pmani_027919 [Petrolisthes manimaculis]
MDYSNKVYTEAALGRPFHLGSLYDMRSEQIISGDSLWNKDLDNFTRNQRLSNAESHVIASNTFSDCASALDISGNLKLSFMGGLVNASGAAKILNNEQQTGRSQRVILQYKCTTRAEELTMERLGSITYPKALDEGYATHVVTGIIYGANAFFVFDRNIKNSQSKNTIDGNLEGIIKMIPVDIGGNVKYSKDDEQMNDNMQCMYIGDFALSENIATYNDAKKTYKELPKLLGETGEKAVPVRVTLFPLILLDRRASKLVREISNNLISDTENTLETLYNLIEKCKDMSTSDIRDSCRTFFGEISEFSSQITKYKYSLQGDLSSLLPNIRGGGEEEIRLAELLERKEQSPFSKHFLNSWIDKKEVQLKILEDYLKYLPEITFPSATGDFETIVMSPSNRHVLCLVIYMPSMRLQLENMYKYNRNKEPGKNCQHMLETSMIPNLSNVNSILQSFKLFDISNKDNTSSSVIAMQEATDTNELSVSILHYKDGVCKSKDYQLPSAPGKVTVAEDDSWHDCVTIRWSPPEHGTSPTQRYYVTYKESESDQSANTVWSDTCHTTLCNLTPNTKYQVAVQAWCEVGYSTCSDISEVKTRPASPPGIPTVHLISPTTVQLRWSPPLIIAPTCSLKSYTVRQKKESQGDEWITKKDQVMDYHSCTLTISSDSPLTFTVVANCNPAGRSRFSQPNDSIANAGSEASTTLKEELIRSSKLVSVGLQNIYQPPFNLTVSRSEEGMARYELGQKCAATEKIIILLGETGVGKTTFLNAMMNYIFGVTWDDSFRFMLGKESNCNNQSESQTTHVTSYTLHYQDGFLVPYTLTFIDTPGFGSHGGIPRDHEIISHIKNLFSTHSSGSITYLNCICLIVPATQSRLTSTQQYISDQIRDIFSDNITENIYLLFTFADAMKPQALNTMKKARIPFKKYYKFNNSIITEIDNENEDDDDEDFDNDFNRHFWNMGQIGYKQFLNDLTQVSARPSPSLHH